jgi:hypothetical protein
LRRLFGTSNPFSAIKIVEFSLSGRSIALTETLLPLAGVLLGKTSFDWLYGLTGGLSQTVPQF